MFETLGLAPVLVEKLMAVRANVLMEDGAMWRTCECGTRHPVGHLRQEQWDAYAFQGERGEGVIAAHRQRSCCVKRCCESWETATSVSAVDPVDERVTD